MEYTKIWPLGKDREQPHGSFDCLYDLKYPSMKMAEENNDFVIGDFVRDLEGKIYIEWRHVRTPENKMRHKLQIQFFPAGIDTIDDYLACELGQNLFL